MTGSARDPHPLEVAGVVELARVERNGLIESRHLGAAIVVDAQRTVLRALGDVEALVYPRSSLKPLQALAVLRAGVDLEGAQLVLASASHAGTPEHVRVAGELLERAGLDEEALHCPRDWPLDATSNALARANGEQRRITMNCSGKHAAFLLACVTNGWSTHDYLDPAHPLQVLIRETIEELSGESVGHLGVDGCGAPLFAVSLRALATALSRIAQSTDPLTARLSTAILENAWAIDGPGRANTVVIEELGILCKGGAEGVMVMATPTGTAVALKVLDGTQRVATLSALELLAEAGAISRTDADRVIALTTERVLGGGVPVGSISTAF